MSATATWGVDVRPRQELARWPSRLADLASVAVVAAAIGSGVYMRGWYLFHRPISSDEAIAGLMARDILHGHFYAFYWGQVYGGVEPYLTAAGFGVFGHSSWVLRAVPVLLSLAAALLAWRVTRRLVGDPVVALLAGAVVWAAPDSAVSNSFIEWGFRGVTLVCGLALLLLVLRILDGDDRWWIYGLTGLVAGIGWWSSPEIAYFLVPAGLLLIGFLWAKRAEIVGLLPRLGILLLAAGVGATPWLWANVNSGFQSLKASAFGVPPRPYTYSDRLHLFFHYSIGMLFSVRDIFGGQWLGGKTVGVGLLALSLVLVGVAMILGLIRGGRAIAVVAGTVAFPFLLALSPGTWFWQTGRYIGYVVPLYVMVVAIGAWAAGRLVSSRRTFIEVREDASRVVARLSMAAVGGFLVALALVSFVRDPTPGISLSSGWGDPNRPSSGAIDKLEKAGVSYGYANYWVAYRLDLLSHDRLKLTVGKGEDDRWPYLNRQVSGRALAAWIFVKPTPAANSQFVSVAGPGGLTETAFTDQLTLNSVAYRVVDAGILDAVVPDTPIMAADFWPHP
jgi:4-amino-4-deoxy-L-arabinose transferase-like glycosyltransferase